MEKEYLIIMKIPEMLEKWITLKRMSAQVWFGAPACGDVMRLQIEVENDTITDAKFKTYGCGSAIASSSLLTEWVRGRTLDEANSIKNTELAQHLALPPVKIHCSVLAEDAIKAAVRDYKSKNED